MVDFEVQGGKQVACLLSFPKQPPAADVPHGARQPDKPAISPSGWDMTPGRARHYHASARDNGYEARCDDRSYVRDQYRT